jgi:hypothetical protein
MVDLCSELPSEISHVCALSKRKSINKKKKLLLEQHVYQMSVCTRFSHPLIMCKNTQECMMNSFNVHPPHEDIHMIMTYVLKDSFLADETLETEMFWVVIGL